MLTLYGYWRSSAAYRVRIACHHKGLAFDNRSVHLVRDGGEQHLPAYGVLNPNHLVPTLVDGDLILNQSLAIIEYLDEAYPMPALLPEGPVARAKARALAQNIASDCHPLNNLRVLKYLGSELKASEAQKTAWYHHWIKTAFEGLELQLEQTSGEFCVGDEVSIADVCLVPQVYNAERFKVALDDYPLIRAITARCRALESFSLAAPEQQPDAL
ncbi:maleylacetoacetate isomerase [Ferrimonas balearica DSM 9799]|uniref:Maleylacetoacetate isomerase n=1 Tax=Ferrimonas balearica (strain DSM 9799 / CCM 4581 / KCTC 23876 / PAT) TaxID=550540 RepID=E1SPG1_FERBD|nr:maleylacetoacetate isomerase [Ferrimonas balearica]ADN76778.1 maleylacetoacetate isomerase [Ferrimonas balearica DSM 9799]MBY5979880.1 maleylacetoacetate isomerase [Ferrimonas balearica]MBY6106655.1 maleylacetoacetate isomerase [Ferrimonas balearica]